MTIDDLSTKFTALKSVAAVPSIGPSTDVSRFTNLRKIMQDYIDMYNNIVYGTYDTTKYKKVDGVWYNYDSDYNTQLTYQYTDSSTTDTYKDFDEDQAQATATGKAAHWQAGSKYGYNEEYLYINAPWEVYWDDTEIEHMPYDLEGATESLDDIIAGFDGKENLTNRVKYVERCRQIMIAAYNKLVDWYEVQTNNDGDKIFSDVEIAAFEASKITQKASFNDCINALGNLPIIFEDGDRDTAGTSKGAIYKMTYNTDIADASWRVTFKEAAEGKMSDGTEIVCGSYTNEWAGTNTTALKELTYFPESCYFKKDIRYTDAANLTTMSYPVEGVASLNDTAVTHFKSVKTLYIPEGVDEFCDSDREANANYLHHFSGNTSIERVVLPSTVKTIQSTPFPNTSTFNVLYIGKNVSSIDGITTSKKLKRIVLSNNNYKVVQGSYVEDIDETQLVHVLLGFNIDEFTPKFTKVTSFSDYLFRGITSLVKVDLSNMPNLTSIGGYCFYGCSNLTTLTLPEGLITIGDRVFPEDSKFTDLVIPDSVTSVGIINHTYLKNITVGKNATRGGYINHTYMSDGLENVYIRGNALLSVLNQPNGYTSGYKLYLAKDYAKYIPSGRITDILMYDSNLANPISVFSDEYTEDCDNYNPNFYVDKDAGAIYNADKTILYKLVNGFGEGETYTIPSTVTSIVRYALNYATYDTIDVGSLMPYIYEYALYYCHCKRLIMNNTTTTMQNGASIILDCIESWEGAGTITLASYAITAPKLRCTLTFSNTSIPSSSLNRITGCTLIFVNALSSFSGVSMGSEPNKIVLQGNTNPPNISIGTTSISGLVTYTDNTKTVVKYHNEVYVKYGTYSLYEANTNWQVVCNLGYVHELNEDGSIPTT